MKNFLGIFLIALLASCATKPTPPVSTPPTTNVKPALAAPASAAKVTHVDNQLRFVVLDYRSRTLPPIGARIAIYRASQRVGEVQITDPVRAGFATADIRDGDVRVGDEAR